MRPRVRVAAEGGTYTVSTRDRGPGRRLFVSREPPEFDVLARAVRILGERGDDVRGSIIVDVGANIGTTTIPALGVHGFARALAFEPDPENAELLRENVALNGLEGRVEIVEAAVTDQRSRVRFGRGGPEAGGWRAGAGSLLAADAKRRETIEVESVTLDGALAASGVEPAEVGLVWLDVQGLEGQVVRGASRLVEARRPLVFAARRRKLERAGGVEILSRRIGDTYAAVSELRTPRPALVPAASLPALLAASENTDILAVA